MAARVRVIGAGLAGSEAAWQCAGPAGHALAVDRVAFAARVTEAISREPRITVRREEITSVAERDGMTIIATGPLTSEALASEIARLADPNSAGEPAAGVVPSGPHLYFY